MSATRAKHHAQSTTSSTRKALPAARTKHCQQHAHCNTSSTHKTLPAARTK
jgi:hypothetical protein